MEDGTSSSPHRTAMAAPEPPMAPGYKLWYVDVESDDPKIKDSRLCVWRGVVTEYAATKPSGAHHVRVRWLPDKGNPIDDDEEELRILGFEEKHDEAELLRLTANADQRALKKLHRHWAPRTTYEKRLGEKPPSLAPPVAAVAAAAAEAEPAAAAAPPPAPADAGLARRIGELEAALRDALDARAADAAAVQTLRLELKAVQNMASNALSQVIALRGEVEVAKRLCGAAAAAPAAPAGDAEVHAADPEAALCANCGKNAVDLNASYSLGNTTRRVNKVYSSARKTVDLLLKLRAQAALAAPASAASAGPSDGLDLRAMMKAAKVAPYATHPEAIRATFVCAECHKGERAFVEATGGGVHVCGWCMDTMSNKATGHDVGLCQSCAVAVIKNEAQKLHVGSPREFLENMLRYLNAYSPPGLQWSFVPGQTDRMDVPLQVYSVTENGALSDKPVTAVCIEVDNLAHEGGNYPPDTEHAKNVATFDLLRSSCADVGGRRLMIRFAPSPAAQSPHVIAKAVVAPVAQAVAVPAVAVPTTMVRPREAKTKRDQARAGDDDAEERADGAKKRAKRAIEASDLQSLRRWLVLRAWLLSLAWASHGMYGLPEDALLYLFYKPTSRLIDHNGPWTVALATQAPRMHDLDPAIRLPDWTHAGSPYVVLRGSDDVKAVLLPDATVRPQDTVVAKDRR